MKVVINKCYGGFSLSKKAVARLAELQGRKAYFFTHEPGNINKHIPVTVESDEGLFFSAFDIPNPDEVIAEPENWHQLSQQEKEAHNKLYETHSLSSRDYERHDPLLVQVVEELGKEANGPCASLKIVEVPDNVEWEIDDYDGQEHIAQKHATWG